MRRIKWVEWGVLAAIVAVLAVPGTVGHWAAAALLAVFVVVLLEAAGLRRRLRR